MSSLLMFNRVYIDWTGDTVSHVDIFKPALWTIASLAFSIVHLSPFQSQSTVYTDGV